MSAIYGILNLADSQRAFVNDIGHKLVFDAVNTALQMHNEDVDEALGIFVERDTEEHTVRYMLPIGGMAQPLGEYAPAAAVKNYGYWDTAYPIRGYGDSKSFTRVAQGYMTIQQLDAIVDGITHRDLSRVRQRLLTAIFEDTNLTWLDPTQNDASLTITRLANTDGTLYPPVLGSDTEADDDHYAETAYNVAAIADANNPVVTTRDEIVEHFNGRGTFGENIVYLHGTDQTPYLEAITGWVGNPDLGIAYGDDTDLSKDIANIPGRIHGRLSGCWLSEWAWIPATYCIAVHLDFPPLLRRVDPGYTGLGTGLQLVAVDKDHPLESARFENRYGFAAGNRLSAAVLEISGGGATYTPPTAYTE